MIKLPKILGPVRPLHPGDIIPRGTEFVTYVREEDIPGAFSGWTIFKESYDIKVSELDIPIYVQED